MHNRNHFGISCCYVPPDPTWRDYARGFFVWVLPLLFAAAVGFLACELWHAARRDEANTICRQFVGCRVEGRFLPLDDSLDFPIVEDGESIEDQDDSEKES